MVNNEYIFIPQKTKKQVKWRRIKLFSLVAFCTFWATFKWASFLPSDASFFFKTPLIILFSLTFAWISLFFFSSIFGFWSILKKRKIPGIKKVHPSEPITTKTAILMPIYNENPLNVFANLMAMAKDLEALGKAEAFDCFVLSDTTNPDLWAEEEILWLKAKQSFPKGMNLFYRHRAKNTARKSGNIEDFCVRWGANYDFMIVLDADSLITAKTMIQSVRLMQANPSTGIIQAPPMIINRYSLFARVQQFAGRVYGALISSGLAYWQVWNSNYWGHNAIIRTKAFIECCGLPQFSGKPPFGGHILSHDFVEAALIQRAGWLAWMIPELKGSYEECPSSIIDFAARDRRWCQGNLQHLRILFSKHFNPVSRLHFTMGIMSYLSSPLWCLFMMMGIAFALWRYFFPPSYFDVSKTLFPSWPTFDSVGIIFLLVLSLAMLFLPKILGVIIVLLRYPKKSDFGGKVSLIISMVAEMLFSALIAPIMMLFQSKFVVDILLGVDTGWNAQDRGENGTPWAEAVKRHIVHTIIGVAVTVTVFLFANNLFFWILPITVGMMLSIPISVISSQVKVGKAAKKMKLFLIPEELKPPKILQDALACKELLEKNAESENGFISILTNPLYNAMHIYMLSVNGPMPEFSDTVAEDVRLKLAEAGNAADLHLNNEEKKYLLYDTENITHFLY